LDGLEQTQAKFHKAFNNHIKDVEDNIQRMKMDLEHAKRSVGNAHEQLERIKGQVDVEQGVIYSRLHRTSYSIS
jgi:archaellum component FlaC